MQQYSDARMTKLILTSCPTAMSKQVSMPNYGHSGVLLMPVKRLPHLDKVDPAAMAWQKTPASNRRVGTMEVVMRGLMRESDGRKRELILFTNRGLASRQSESVSRRGPRCLPPEMKG